MELKALTSEVAVLIKRVESTLPIAQEQLHKIIFICNEMEAMNNFNEKCLLMFESNTEALN